MFKKYLFVFAKWSVPLVAAVGCSQPPAYEASTATRNIEIGKDIDDITDFNREAEDTKTASFLSSELAAGELSFNLEEQSFSQNIEMTSVLQEHSKNFTQINREQINDSFTQGGIGQSTTELFTQSEPDRELDILVVVDNSGSMNQEQTNLSTKLDPLLSYVSDADWKVSVVTTDPSQPCQVPNGLIEKGDANASSKFANAVSAGTSGSGNEQGVLRSVQGLQACTGVSPWVRSSSNIAILVVSDEDNCSNGNGCGANPWGQPDFLTDYLATVRVPGVNARVYGLFHIPGESCSTAYNVGNQYNALVNSTNGSAGSICSSDYTNTLAQISNDISDTLESTFTLSNTPTAGTLKVYVNNVLRVSGYSLAGNTVEFTSNIPAAGSQIRFVYDFGSTPVRAEFDLSQVPGLETLGVYINNVLQPTSAYSYSAGNNSIIFNNTPPYNASVLVSYRKFLPALITDFDIVHTNASDVAVKVNGSILSANQYSYNSSNGIVSLTQAPIDGAAIIVDYRTFVSEKLSYSIALADWVLADMTVQDNAAQEVPYVYSNGAINFDLSEWSDGRQITVKSNTINPNHNIISLQENVLNETILVSYNGTTCNLGGDLMVNSGNEVDISNCPFSFNDMSIPLNVSYTYVANQLQSFSVDPAMWDTDYAIVAWEVKVNGVMVGNYSIDNAVLTFDGPLDYEDEVVLTGYYFNDEE